MAEAGLSRSLVAKRPGQLGQADRLHGAERSEQHGKAFDGGRFMDALKTDRIIGKISLLLCETLMLRDMVIMAYLLDYERFILTKFSKI